jgi:hypothetical protein
MDSKLVEKNIHKVNMTANRLIASSIRKEKLVISEEEESLIRWYMKGKFRATKSTCVKCAAIEKKLNAQFNIGIIEQ